MLARFVFLMGILALHTVVSHGAVDNTLYFDHLKIESGLSQNAISQVMMDSRGFMWFATRDGLNRYDGYRFKIFGYDPLDQETCLGNNNTVSLFESGDGNIWVGTIDGVYIFDADKESFSRFSRVTDDGTGVHGKIMCMTADKSRNIWIASYGIGVFRYDTQRNKLHHYRHAQGRNSLSSDKVTSICVDRDNTVWVSVLGLGDGGLNRYNPGENTFTHYKEFHSGINKVTESDDNNLLIGTPRDGLALFNRVSKEVKTVRLDQGKDIFVTDLMAYGKEVWVGTTDGLYIYNRMRGEVQKLESSYSDPSSLSSSNITSIVRDRDGGIWIGTFSGGVNYLPSTHGNFEKFHPVSCDGEMRGKEIRRFCEDSEGKIWIATEANGLNVFDPLTNRFRNVFNGPGQLSGHDIQTMLIDSTELYVGYLGNGFDVVDIRTGEKKNYFTTTNGQNDNSVLALCRDCEGNLWIGTTTGANFYNKETRSYSVVIPEHKGEFIYDIIEDRDRQIWFASYNNGVYVYNPRTREWINYRNRRGDNGSLGYDRTIGLFEDSTGNIWVLTEGGGVSCFSKTSGKFRTYRVEDGLPNNVIYMIEEDAAGNLWMTSNKGLSCFNPVTGQFRNYSFSNGPFSDQFCHKSGLKARNGMIYFGGTEGFIRFDPKRIKVNTQSSPVVLTGFQVFNRDAEIGKKSSPLQESIVKAGTIRLGYRQNTFSFDFATLDYSEFAVKQYAFKMEGYENDWTNIRDNHRVTYSNVPSGKYSFRIVGTNSDGVWNMDGRSIDVVIAPAPWLSPWAMTLYTLLGLGLIYFFIRSYRRRMNNRKGQIVREMTAMKEKAVYEAKVMFFTAVAHEVKTPLSLIKAPFEMLSRIEPGSVEYAENLEIMGENIDRLLVLTNQLLDISKIENQDFMFNYSLVNINKLLENVLHRFQAAFRQKNIDARISLPRPHIVTCVDNELFIKIISNLVNNATKFADRMIDISLHQSGEYLVFRVTNDGRVIPAEHMERIFETFYQIPGSLNTGVGIGLSLVKQLVELHKGRIFLDRSLTDMNSFVVEIPLMGEKPVQRDEDGPQDVSDEFSENPDNRKMTILVVEDDKNMHAFLKKLLSKRYRVITAGNGEEALLLLKGKMADLIVSDVMMPLMDGFAFCREIKTRIEFSHIPVILLTAKFDLQSKIDGMEAGADAYIEKPFSPDFLLAQIANILQNKKILKETFLNSPLTLTNTLAGSAEDERFLRRINEIIVGHMSDQSFTVDQMAIELNMGRSSLYRKIKEVAHVNPNDFIRLIRLKKAAEMIESGEVRINEICFMIGYSSSSYFAKCFQKQFGVLPKEFAKSRAKDKKG